MPDTRVRIVFEFRTRRQQCSVTCRACGRCVFYPPGLAIETFGAMTAIDALERRLRCTGCGTRGARVAGVWREYHG